MSGRKDTPAADQIAALQGEVAVVNQLRRHARGRIKRLEAERGALQGKVERKIEDVKELVLERADLRGKIERLEQELADTDAERNVSNANVAQVEEWLFNEGYRYEGETFEELFGRFATDRRGIVLGRDCAKCGHKSHLPSTHCPDCGESRCQLRRALGGKGEE